MEKLHNYAKMAIRMGSNIQAGQKLLIWCPVDAAYFARLVMIEAYKAGAEDVVIHWIDGKSAKIHCTMAPDSRFINKEDENKEQRRKWENEGYKMLWIYTPEPNLFKGVDPKRIRQNQEIMPALQWTLVSIPNTSWACMVFPEAQNEADAINLMWDAIFHASRMDGLDPHNHWNAHIDTLLEKADLLTSHQFHALYYKNSLGTDLMITLPENHVWISCAGKTALGERFTANIPTEEVFTSPLRTGVNGLVYATRPLVFMGEIINGFWLRFFNGKVVECKAKKNQHLLEKLLNSHENAAYLGEVALVPHSSPISKSKILWYDSSFDENASCHLAFGQSYPQTIRKEMDEKLSSTTLNYSPIHEDFMIGSADLDITGIKQNGDRIPVFRQGEWAL